MENYKKFIVAFIILILVSSLFAYKKSTIAFFPFGAYSDETSVFLGAHVIYTWHPDNLPQNYSPPSLELNTIASFKKQVRLLLRNKFILYNDNFSVGIPLRYYNWPTTFYGIANQKEPELYEKYTRCYLEFYPYLAARISDNYSLTTTLYLETSSIVKSEEDNPLLDQYIVGFDDYFINGIGFNLRKSTTDNSRFPRSGSNLSFSTRIYDEAAGSDFTFQRYMLDLRKYITLSREQTLAGQFVYETIRGSFPFEKYPDIGSRMRGLDNHIFINDSYFLFRIEDRIFPFDNSIWDRFGFAIFAETGQTFGKDFSDITTDNQKVSAGMGLRYILQQEEKINLRLDFSFSNEGMEMNIISFEAF